METLYFVWIFNYKCMIYTDAHSLHAHILTSVLTFLVTQTSACAGLASCSPSGRLGLMRNRRCGKDGCVVPLASPIRSASAERLKHTPEFTQTDVEAGVFVPWEARGHMFV